MDSGWFQSSFHDFVEIVSASNPVVVMDLSDILQRWHNLSFKDQMDQLVLQFFCSGMTPKIAAGASAIESTVQQAILAWGYLTFLVADQIVQSEDAGLNLGLRFKLANLAVYRIHELVASIRESSISALAQVEELISSFTKKPKEVTDDDEVRRRLLLCILSANGILQIKLQDVYNGLGNGSLELLWVSKPLVDLR